MNGKNYQKVKFIEKYNNSIFRINGYVIWSPNFTYI